MAKAINRNRRQPKADGPYLSAAVLCEKVLEEKDGVQSLIRIVDRFIVTAPDGTADAAPVTLNVHAFLSFKSGFAQGSYTVKATLEAPNGTDTQLAELPVLFEGQDRGANVVLRLSLGLKEQGLYWIAVSLQGAIMTRIPLRVLHQWVTSESSS